MPAYYNLYEDGLPDRTQQNTVGEKKNRKFVRNLACVFDLAQSRKLNYNDCQRSHKAKVLRGDRPTGE